MSHANRYRTTPIDPAEVARLAAQEAEASKRAEIAKAAREKDPRNWGIDVALAEMETGEGIIVSKDITGRATRAQRYDCFALLRRTPRRLPNGEPGTVLTGDQMIRIDQMHRLLAIRHQTAGSNPTTQPIDGVTPKDYPKARLEAGVRLDGLLAHMDAAEAACLRAARSVALPHGSRLLLALSTPSIAEGRPVNNWRAIVERLTGHFRHDEQSSYVRKACERLEAAFDAGADKAALDAYYDKRERVAA